MNQTLVLTARTPARLVRDVLGLFKLRIGLMIMITALVGFAVTPGPAPSLAQVLVLALSVFISSASAGAFNQYVEAESDRLMARTRHPPHALRQEDGTAGQEAAAGRVARKSAEPRRHGQFKCRGLVS